jgi:hypothetical protein
VNSVVAACADLVALRRKQYATVADALSGALQLEEVVQALAVTHSFTTTEQLLQCAPDEETRAHWSSFIDRATTPVPTDLQEI